MNKILLIAEIKNKLLIEQASSVLIFVRTVYKRWNTITWNKINSILLETDFIAVNIFHHL